MCQPIILFLVDFFLRILVLILQRGIGIEWDFHIDATFYVDRIMEMRSIGWMDSILNGGFENFLYTLVGYILYEVCFGYILPQSMLIVFNILISTLTIKIIIDLTDNSGFDKKQYAAIFYAASPYFCHLSVHPLKDVFVIYLSILFLRSVVRGSWVYVIMSALTLITARFYLGVFTVVVIMGWRLFAFNVKKKISIFYNINFNDCPLFVCG